MKKLFISAAVVLASLTLNAKVFNVGEIHRVDLSTEVDRPALSADGSFVVAQSNSGLQKIDLATGQTETLVKGENLYGVSISPDGKTVVYTRPTFNKKLRYTSLESVNTDSKSTSTIVKATRNLAAGVALTDKEIKAVNKGKMSSKTLNKDAQAQSPRAVVAIDRGHLLVDGKAIDPQGKGSYLWPSLSPDGTKIVYWCVGRGCFVSNLDGSDAQSLGALRAAVWAGNDAIIGMQDKDNGEYVIESKLVAHDLKSGEKQVLTDSSVVAMYPSATESRVAFVNDEGVLYFMDINK